jgi:hypothetical protein
MSEDYIDSEDDMYWDCYDENDDDLLTYWNNDELVIQGESEHIFDLIKVTVKNTILPLFDMLTIEGLKDFLFNDEK